MFRVTGRLLSGDYKPRNHGNWKHGWYRKAWRADMRMVRHCIAALNGREIWSPPMPPPGWRLFPYARNPTIQ